LARWFDPHGSRWRERWEEDEADPREARDLFDREAQFARSSGDPRWGTGGMPVDDYPRRPPYPPVARAWPPRGEYREPVERPSPAYGDWEASSRRGPFSGRGPRGYRRSDDRILEEVCERFTEHGQLDPSDVEVSVRSGEVFLTGTVATRAEKRLAEDIADDVFGVAEVHNRLHVHRPGEPVKGGPEA
jgi:hypothetical protein